MNYCQIGAYYFILCSHLLPMVQGSQYVTTTIVAYKRPVNYHVYLGSCANLKASNMHYNQTRTRLFQTAALRHGLLFYLVESHRG